MRLKTLVLAGLCCFGWSCSSTTDEGEWDLRQLDYSLDAVDGEAVPGPLSSLPGLRIWEGNDGTILTVARGELACNPDGTAEELYLFRLAEPGSAIWDPIRVKIDVTCERFGSGSVRFRNRNTGETLDGTILERFDGCSVIEKALPSLISLKAGYSSANSGARFPAGVTFSGPTKGNFLEAQCYGF